MKKFSPGLLVIASLVVFSSYTQSVESEVKTVLEKAMNGIKILSIEPLSDNGLFLVALENGESILTDRNASFFMQGELFSTAGGKLRNLTEEQRKQDRKAKITGISPKSKITFPAYGKTKAKITVFTDIDCGYCRKLHREIPRMNEYGIEVSYLAYPRAGFGSDSYKKFVSVWCSDDRLKALTSAKAGNDIAAKDCKNPVTAQFELGKSFGIKGTPATVLEDGQLLPGYLSADKLATNLGLL